MRDNSCKQAKSYRNRRSILKLTSNKLKWKMRNRPQAMSRHVILSRVCWLLIAAFLMIVASGCIPTATPTEVAAPTSNGSCFPQSVFTADDMRARVDCHPDDFKMEINEETVVLFAFPDPLLDWAGPIFVVHIPSVSEVVLNTDGEIVFEGYKSVKGQNAIEEVLNNQELITRILERAKDITK